MKDKKMLFGIVVVFVFLLSMGLTYSYFTVTTNIEGEPNDVLTSTGTLSLVYNSGPEISVPEIYPGWTTTKTFTVTNTGSLNAYYSINWEEINNTILRNELVMSLSCTGEDCRTSAQKPVGKIAGAFEDKIKIAPGITHTYTLTLSFIETSTIQNYNQGKVFGGKISIRESDGYFDLYGTLVDASNAPIQFATVTLHSTPRTTVTDSNGNFMFENVEPDNHTLSVEVEGEEVLDDALTIIAGETSEITDSTVTKKLNAKQLNVKIKASADKSIESIEEVYYTLSSSWATTLDITKDNIIAIAVEKTLESPSTYTYDGVTYNRSQNGIDVSENTDGTVLASTYTDGTNEVIVMINSRGMTSLPEDSSSAFLNFFYLEYLQSENLDTSKVADMEEMFNSVGTYATTFNLDLSTWDTSQVINMFRMFDCAGRNATTWSIGDLSQWDTSQVTNMNNMFYSAGSRASTFNLDLSNWNTSQVINMANMFGFAGQNATTWNIGDLSNWDTSQVTNMNGMFRSTGSSDTTWNIGDLSSWNTSQVKYMGSMFSSAGYNATTWNIGDLSSWDTSQVENMSGMFFRAGYKDPTFNIVGLSNWNTSKVTTMKDMFSGAGETATTWNIGDLSSWNTSQVENMSNMFSSTGYYATTWNIGDLSSWDTSQVRDMSYMFSRAGISSSTFNLDLNNWDTSQVTNMRSMFASAGYYATTFNLNLSSWDTSKVTNMREMFQVAGYNATTSTLNIKGFNLSSTNTTLTSYSSIFNGMKSNAQIIVGSQDSKDWILGLSSDNRPSAWINSNIIVE